MSTLYIDEGSEFDKINGWINLWNSAINDAKDQINTLCTSNINSYNAVNLGSWSDQLAQNLNQYCGEVRTGLETVQGDLNGGNFRSLNDALVDLSSKLTSCQNIQNAINSYIYQYNHETKESRQNKLMQKINNNKALLRKAVAECNNIIAVFPSIDFQSNYSFVSNGSNIEPELGDIVDDSDDGGNSGGSVAENFDYDALRDSMNDLFQWGVFTATISYNGQYIYLKDISGGSGRAFAFCDGYGNQISGTPTFTKDQVSYMNHVQSNGEAVYPEVEAAAVEYFSKHQ